MLPHINKCPPLMSVDGESGTEEPLKRSLSKMHGSEEAELGRGGFWGKERVMIRCHKGSKDFPYASDVPCPVLGSVQTPRKDDGARGPPDSEVERELQSRWARPCRPASLTLPKSLPRTPGTP